MSNYPIECRQLNHLSIGDLLSHLNAARNLDNITHIIGATFVLCYLKPLEKHCHFCLQKSSKVNFIKSTT
ncbi:hypothetical protein VCRA2113O415_100056 [Vibrio crassostreae]|nr:hypothetical protein VCRA2113O415_100056 [Vibrio crassostreae]CAK2935184.1 hypothetical protein VCRA2113O420_50138 [Vibrio crassostreae]CAK3542498.1 hypothetical protein VCRA2121O436_50110 [Vibrio crassostreae]